MRYVDYVYDIVRLDCLEMDAIYADYIKQMVGVYGLNALIDNRLIESCGVVNGRQLYTLCAPAKLGLSAEQIQHVDKPIEELEEIEELKRENQKLRSLLMKGF